jgi:hypothetical protein
MNQSCTEFGAKSSKLRRFSSLKRAKRLRNEWELAEHNAAQRRRPLLAES